jgi:hypothetical protein
MIIRYLLATAAVMLIWGITPAYAGTVKYTFADDNGNAYCDGLTLTETSTTAVGTHTGSCLDGDYAGGFATKFHGVTDKMWIISTTDMLNGPGYVYVFVLDQKALTWVLWAENTSANVTFEMRTSGTLLKSTPPAVIGPSSATASSSAHSN